MFAKPVSRCLGLFQRTQSHQSVNQSLRSFHSHSKGTSINRLTSIDAGQSAWIHTEVVMESSAEPVFQPISQPINSTFAPSINQSNNAFPFQSMFSVFHNEEADFVPTPSSFSVKQSLVQPITQSAPQSIVWADFTDVVPSIDASADQSINQSEGMQCDSVKRKRVKKMNRHKHKKRLKKERHMTRKSSTQ